MVDLFFDTYALIELTKSNPNYVKVSDEIVVTTRFNLVELFYRILEDFGEKRAEEVFHKFEECEAHVPDDILFKAMLFRLKNKKKGFSYVDCIGYVFSLENKMRFLTGDNAFKDMNNVEFVK